MCVFAFVQQGDTERSGGMGEVLGVTPDHTSFNHVRVCNHFVHIFGCTGDRSCYCTNCTHREGGFVGGWVGGGGDSLMEWRRRITLILCF